MFRSLGAAIAVLVVMSMPTPTSAYDEAQLQQLLGSKDCAECDLSNATLKGVNLLSAALRGTNLTNADLSGANLKHADLCDADLAFADLKAS